MITRISFGQMGHLAHIEMLPLPNYVKGFEHEILHYPV